MTTYKAIPIARKQPWFSMQIVLSQQRYTLELRYNLRMDRWILSVADAAGAPILVGIPMLIDRDLVSQYATLRLPPGPLFVMDETGKQLQAGLSSFFVDHVLVYGEDA